MDEDVLWEGPARRGRGPRPALSRGLIVGRAVEIADAEGFEALSMQHLARRLGFGTMSLYRHIGGKDELVALMLDAAIGLPLLAGPGPWRTLVRDWAHGIRQVFLRHPWTLPLVPVERVMGPNESAWAEAALSAFAATGLPPPLRLEMVMLVNSYVRGCVAFEIRPARAVSRDTLVRVGRLDEFPLLADALAGSEVDGAARDTGFDFGLERVLDGIEAFLTAEQSNNG
ncbi:TetR/AcrR family transcriptional regulator [Pseudonocardia spinosispora]|uniref:TetR/AcrR family transcriptional regulator n=1 Tax=Pseudonocardia spinosispora TaxID=103441 RepID=UPI0003F5F169|nr:TetR/AcrR family transcriptional regulator [Pseudonocardia spinosispora]